MNVILPLYYLIGTIAALEGSWKKDKVILTCSIALLFWYVMAYGTYERNVIETIPTIAISLIFIGTMSAICAFWPSHWLPKSLLLMGVLMLVWTMYYTEGSAFVYKETKNLFYGVFGLAPIFLSWWGSPLEVFRLIFKKSNK